MCGLKNAAVASMLESEARTRATPPITPFTITSVDGCWARVVLPKCICARPSIPANITPSKSSRKLTSSKPVHGKRCASFRTSAPLCSGQPRLVSHSILYSSFLLRQLQAEIKIHRTLKHPHVCEFKHFFEDKENCYILLELCHNQSMNELLKRRKRLTEPEAAYYMTHVLQAVQYLHDKNVIHRDLKLGNLFLDKQLHIKVGDLGLATRVDDRDEKRKTICGTPNYIAPEIIQNDKAKRGHSFEVDVWSMGVILYTLLVGKPPYEAKNVKATYQRILKNEYSFPPHSHVSSTARDLVGRMLQSEPSDRCVENNGIPRSRL